MIAILSIASNPFTDHINPSKAFKLYTSKLCLSPTVEDIFLHHTPQFLKRALSFAVIFTNFVES